MEIKKVRLLTCQCALSFSTWKSANPMFKHRKGGAICVFLEKRDFQVTLLHTNHPSQECQPDAKVMQKLDHHLRHPSMACPAQKLGDLKFKKNKFDFYV